MRMHGNAWECIWLHVKAWEGEKEEEEQEEEEEEEEERNEMK
jgi:hypothetical protein